MDLCEVQLTEQLSEEVSGHSKVRQQLEAEGQGIGIGKMEEASSLQL